MQNILKKLQDLCHECEGIIGAYKDAHRKLKEQSDTVEAKRKSLEATEAHIAERHATLKEQENRLLRHDQLDQKAANHDDEVTRFSNERQAFEQQKAAALKEIEDKKSFNETWAKKLQEGQANLDKDRQEYKAKVIAAIAADEERRKPLNQG